MCRLACAFAVPITQPPVGCDQLATGRHGSVGVPIVSSLAIVDPASLAPLPFGNNGVIAISGPTVMRSYLGNAAADRESFFYLSCADGAGFEGDERFFLTGDVGHLSEDGHLTISGRSKELIKRGGEQVSPHEVEEALLQHEWVRAAVVFAVPSQLWGEEVGVAIVLDPLSPREADDARLLAKAMRQACAAAQLTPGKWPSVVLAVEAQQLPTTSTGKPIRTDLAATLSVSAAAMTTEPARLGSPKVSKALDGVRYFLACQVVFNHVGYQQMAEGTWGVVAQARFFCIHVPTFFALAGFSLAIAMGPPPRSKLGYVAARLSPMLPMYLVSIALLLLNTVLMCHPASFDVSFHWLAQPDDQSRGDFCEPAPLLSGWWSSLLTTLAIYTLGLQSWPLFLYSWFLSYYTWFSSVYYALLALHPSLYARLVPLRGNRRRLWLITIVIALLNGCVVAGWVVGWARPRIDGGGELDADEEAEFVGHFSLMYYLFPPFWWPSFALGTMAAFLFDAYRPNLSHRAYLWGVLCDLISAALLLQAAAYMLLASCVQKEGHLCPSAVDNGLDNKGLEHWLGVGEEDALGSRTLAGIVSRAYLPLMVLWLYAMAVGRGLTCFVFSRPLFVDTLAPASYNVYLFHQWVGQLYYLATRHEWWRSELSRRRRAPCASLPVLACACLCDLTALPRVPSRVPYDPPPAAATGASAKTSSGSRRSPCRWHGTSTSSSSSSRRGGRSSCPESTHGSCRTGRPADGPWCGGALASRPPTVPPTEARRSRSCYARSRRSRAHPSSPTGRSPNAALRVSPRRCSAAGWWPLSPASTWRSKISSRWTRSLALPSCSMRGGSRPVRPALAAAPPRRPSRQSDARTWPSGGRDPDRSVSHAPSGLSVRTCRGGRQVMRIRMVCHMAM